MRLILLLWISVSSLWNVKAGAQFNNPSSVPIWCGKAYQSTNASFNPGGWLEEPKDSSVPLLDFRAFTQYNVYLEDEATASLILEAQISHTVGSPLCETPSSSYGVLYHPRALEVNVRVGDSATIARATIFIGSRHPSRIELPLASLATSSTASTLTITAHASACNVTYTVTTELLKLPKRTDGGTVARLDRSSGGLFVQDYQSSGWPWKAIFPYSYYVNYGGWLIDSVSQLDVFKSYGFNIIHIVPPGGSEPYNWTYFDALMDRADELQLWVMYDMRNTYLNLTSVSEQVEHLKRHKSLLLWYTADEPDGNSDPLNSTRIAFDKLRQLDPYKPVSLVLNCYNFYFQDYTSGADIIMEDVYPIATNLTWSDEWDTPCNTTYGDCGCDDCHAPVGSLADIPERYKRFQDYQAWLGQANGPPKAIWGVPQAFGGSEYWTREPTAQEEAAMAMLRVNHDAKGIVAWTWPTTPVLANVTGALARVLSREDVTAALTGSNALSLKTNLDASIVDVAAWRYGRNKTLVSVVSVTDAGSAGRAVRIGQPRTGRILEVLWGGGRWSSQNGNLQVPQLPGLSVDLFFVESS